MKRFEVGKCYTSHDDALYKVLAVYDDCIVVLSYSHNHRVCNPWIYKLEEVENLEEVDEEEDWYYYSIFDDLKYADYNTLVPKA